MDYSIVPPSRPRVVKEEENTGVYEIEGLYTGYGHTLGNSLRRVILSSLPGAAITEVNIDGSPHEFSTIPGVKEDVITMLLNLKRVRFRLHTDEPQKATLSARGVKEITAADLKTPSQLEVANPDQHIATLTSKDAELKFEITVEKGLGYVPKEALYKGRVEAGTIHLNAVFTPVKRVNYEVENMRVGDRTDYNRLRFFIETDGSVSPREALEESIRIMTRHLHAIAGVEDDTVTEEEVLKEVQGGLAGRADDAKREAPSGLEETEILKTRVEDLNLSSRTVNALGGAGIRTVGGLVRKKEDDLLSLDGVGKKAVQEIRRAIGNFGLTLK